MEKAIGKWHALESLATTLDSRFRKVEAALAWFEDRQDRGEKEMEEEKGSLRATVWRTGLVEQRAYECVERLEKIEAWLAEQWENGMEEDSAQAPAKPSESGPNEDMVAASGSAPVMFPVQSASSHSATTPVPKLVVIPATPQSAPLLSQPRPASPPLLPLPPSADIMHAESAETSASGHLSASGHSSALGHLSAPPHPPSPPLMPPSPPWKMTLPEPIPEASASGHGLGLEGNEMEVDTAVESASGHASGPDTTIAMDIETGGASALGLASPQDSTPSPSMPPSPPSQIPVPNPVPEQSASGLSSPSHEQDRSAPAPESPPSTMQLRVGDIVERPRSRGRGNSRATTPGLLRRSPRLASPALVLDAAMNVDNQ